jgi:hypothetical protein
MSSNCESSSSDITADDMPNDGVPTTACAGCDSVVPTGAFCGRCGAYLGKGADRLHVLRPRVFAVAPRERVLVPMVTSSIFPHLPQSYRSPFRIGILLLLLGLVCSALLGFRGPLVIIAALGVPLLFGLYLWQSGLLRDMPGHALVTAATKGAALGVGWVL